MTRYTPSQTRKKPDAYPQEASPEKNTSYDSTRRNAQYRKKEDVGWKRRNDAKGKAKNNRCPKKKRAQKTTGRTRSEKNARKG